MTNLEIRTRSMFDGLSKAEQKAASYFLNHVESVFHMPIASLAAESGASQVAWVRFCKTMGFDGLKGLKKQLFLEMNAKNQEGKPAEPLYSDITGHSNMEELVELIRLSEIQAINDTIKLMDPMLLQAAAIRIIQATSVKLFGVGASAVVAENFYYKLLRIGINVVFCRDNHIQLTYAANLTEKDVAVFISHSGRTVEVLEALQIAKARGANVITITKYGKMPLIKQADFALFTSCPEVYRRSGAMSSRIAQLVVVDVLYSAIAHLDYDRVKESLENSYNSCITHKVNGRLI
jgi:DNA-binding MurR/RpiR family transcriptional regulator